MRLASALRSLQLNPNITDDAWAELFTALQGSQLKELKYDLAACTIR